MHSRLLCDVVVWCKWLNINIITYFSKNRHLFCLYSKYYMEVLVPGDWHHIQGSVPGSAPPYHCRFSQPDAVGYFCYHCSVHSDQSLSLTIVSMLLQFYPWSNTICYLLFFKKLPLIHRRYFIVKRRTVNDCITRRHFENVIAKWSSFSLFFSAKPSPK